MRQSLCWYQQKNKRRAIQGLTLVEVLVTVTILAAIVTGVGASFFSGLKLWDRVRKVDFVRTEFLLDLGIIARELRQSVDIPLIGCEGNAGSFSFPAVDRGAVVKVTYALDPLSGNLTRHVQGFADIIAGREVSAGFATKALSADKVSFQYLSVDGETSSWVDTWPKDKGMFSAVRLEGVFKSEPFSKIIIIPVA